MSFTLKPLQLSPLFPKSPLAELEKKKEPKTTHMSDPITTQISDLVTTPLAELEKKTGLVTTHMSDLLNSRISDLETNRLEQRRRKLRKKALKCNLPECNIAKKFVSRLLKCKFCNAYFKERSSFNKHLENCELWQKHKKSKISKTRKSSFRLKRCIYVNPKFAHLLGNNRSLYQF